MSWQLHKYTALLYMYFAEMTPNGSKPWRLLHKQATKHIKSMTQ